MSPSRRAVPAVVASLVLAALVIDRALASDATRTLEHDGRTRRYILHTPPETGDRKLPLVFVLHGGGGDAEGMVKLTRGKFDALADREGFLVCYPEGVEKGWNDGRELPARAMAKRQGLDDVGFISSLIDAIARERPVDPTRVYATGMSNGGFMSYRLGADLADRIAAIAPVCGNLFDEVKDRAVHGRPVPLLAINGEADPLVPWAGGDVTVLFLKRGKCLSTAESIRLWSERNHAKTTPEVLKLPEVDATDTTRVREEVHAAEPGGAPVVLLAVEDGGHTWPGGIQYLPERSIGKTTRQIDACEVIWRFFKEQRLTASPEK